MNESVLVIDKTRGPTSFDVVREVRNYVNIKKVGHAGSLDPFATGVLVLLTGKATKLSNALLNADKRYIGLLKLGSSTDSMDCTGKVTQEMPVPELSEAQIDGVLRGFEGEWQQIPPMHSAKKIQGVRLYTLARKNLSVEREPIPVQLFEVRLLKWESPFITFEVHCSKGTYIRVLADEIAKRLGTVGHLSELRRTACGNFKLSESLTVDALVKSGADWQKQAYANYRKLLTSEGVIRNSSPHLPTRNNSGNSLLN